MAKARPSVGDNSQKLGTWNTHLTTGQQLSRRESVLSYPNDSVGPNVLPAVQLATAPFRQLVINFFVLTCLRVIVSSLYGLPSAMGVRWGSTHESLPQGASLQSRMFYSVDETRI